MFSMICIGLLFFFVARKTKKTITNAGETVHCYSSCVRKEELAVSLSMFYSVNFPDWMGIVSNVS